MAKSTIDALFGHTYRGHVGLSATGYAHGISILVLSVIISPFDRMSGMTRATKNGNNTRPSTSYYALKEVVMTTKLKLMFRQIIRLSRLLPVIRRNLKSTGRYKKKEKRKQYTPWLFPEKILELSMKSVNGFVE